jgi:tRNA dimethylallyltransferase
MTGIVAVIGPTAVGKSRLAMTIAQHYYAEIISADSRQIYRHMDIGTAKPSVDDQTRVKHHLIDIIYPDDTFSVAEYKTAADGIIADIIAGGKIPVLVGGSGQYIWALLENWQIPLIMPDTEFRSSMLNEAEIGGFEVLHAELRRIDPESGSKIHPTNIRRVIRALEIHHQTGRKASDFAKKGRAINKTLIIGLTSERKTLYHRIDGRVDNMISQGLVEEVKNLIDTGYTSELPSMSGIGYQQISAYIKGRLSLDEAIQRIKYATHRFARSQYNWFRLHDPRITWYDADDDNDEKIIYTIKTFLENS